MDWPGKVVRIFISCDTEPLDMRPLAALLAWLSRLFLFLNAGGQRSAGNDSNERIKSASPPMRAAESGCSCQGSEQSDPHLRLDHPMIRLLQMSG